MQFNQIAQALNETIVPNVLGEGQTIAENLSNIMDLGKAIANVRAEDLKDYTSEFVARVAKTYFDERIFKKVIGSLFIDFTEYGGVVQRVKSGLMEVTDSLSRNLQNGTTYNQDVYKGMTFDNKVYTKDCGFELDWSIPHNMWIVTTPEDVLKIIGYIENRAEQTINANLFALQLSVLRGLIVSHAASRIKLITAYNTENQLSGADAVTINNYSQNADFLRYVAKTISLIKRGIQDISAKANDGTITTHTPAEDIRVTLLSKFAADVKFDMMSDVYHKELVEIGEYDEVNFWQNSGTSILPDLAVNGEVLSSLDETGEADPVHVEYCVGIIRDRLAAGITTHQEIVTNHYNAKGNFTNYFQDVSGNLFIDTRENTVILTLE